MKRITVHFDLEDKDMPRYMERHKLCMARLLMETFLGDGKPPQRYFYPEGDVTVEWESPPDA
jgi:hypothetical protein